MFVWRGWAWLRDHDGRGRHPAPLGNGDVPAHGRGGHWYGYASRFLADAITNWGLFEPVPDQPSDWTYQTVSQGGRRWDLRYTFDAPPDSLATFVRSGERLSAAGEGAVHLRTTGGCELDLTLPFEADVPATACAT